MEVSCTECGATATETCPEVAPPELGPRAISKAADAPRAQQVGIRGGRRRRCGSGCAAYARSRLVQGSERAQSKEPRVRRGCRTKRIRLHVFCICKYLIYSIKNILALPEVFKL